MPKTIEAIYEHGVFKPVSAVDIKEHAKVHLIVEEAKGIVKATSGIIPAKNKQTVDIIALEPEFLSEEA